MKIHKRLAALVLALVLCLASAVTVSAAHPAVDLDKKGSISLKMTYNEQAVGGGSLVYYQVGEVKEDNGDFSFIPTSDFKDQFEEIETQKQMEAEVSGNLAAKLADYAKQNSVAGTQVTIPDDGEVKLYSLASLSAREGEGDVLEKYKSGALGALPEPDLVSVLLGREEDETED